MDDRVVAEDSGPGRHCVDDRPYPLPGSGVPACQRERPLTPRPRVRHGPGAGVRDARGRRDAFSSFMRATAAAARRCARLPFGSART